MKFDYIIMNPPYDGSLHLSIVEFVLRFAIDTCINLSPIRWLQDPLAIHKKGVSDYVKFEKSISIKLSELDVIPANYVNKFFSRPILLQPLGIYKLTSLGGFNYVDFNRNTIIEKVINVCNNSFSRLNIVSYNDNLKNYVCLNTMAPSMKYGRPYYDTLKNFGYFIDGKNKDGYNYSEAKAHCKEATRGDVSKTLCVVFNTENEVKNCWDSFNTDFCRYCISSSVVDIHVHQKFLPWVNELKNPRTGLIGYKSAWIDDDFYKVFDISFKEKEQIEMVLK